jgi:hypothetical protein
VTDAVGQLLAAGADVGALGAQLRELGIGAEDLELAELDALGAELTAQLVEGLADLRRLGDGVSGVLRRDARSVTPVSHGCRFPAAAPFSADVRLR